MKEQTKAVKPRIETLQVVRAIGAISIFISHAFSNLGKWGGFGTSIFFVISGFLMFYAYFDREIETNPIKALLFSIRKIKKLYLLMLLLIIYILFNKQGYSSNIILQNLLLIKVWNPKESVYFSLGGVSWYLCDTFYLYTVFPYILRRIKKIQGIKNAVVRIFIVYGLMLVAGYISGQIDVSNSISNNFSKWFTYIFPLYRLGDFVIGGYLGSIYVNYSMKRTCVLKHKTKKILMLSVMEVSGIILFLFFLFLRRMKTAFLGESWFRSTLFWLPFSCFLVLIFTIFYGGVFSSVLSKLNVIRLIGDLSPYTFLIHVQIIHLCEENIRIKGNETENKIVVVCIAFVLAQMIGAYIKHFFNETKQ